MMRMAKVGERCRIVPDEGVDRLHWRHYDGPSRQCELIAELDTDRSDTGTVIATRTQSAGKQVQVEVDPPNRGRFWFSPANLERIEDNGQETDASG